MWALCYFLTPKLLTIMGLQDIGGLTLVIGFRADACLSEGIDASTTLTTDSVHGLSTQFAGLSTSLSPEEQPHIPRIDMLYVGVDVQQGALVKMAIRPDGQVDWKEVYPQLFLSATPHLFVATHSEGRVTRITKWEVGTPEMEEIERGLQPTFWKLKHALETIQELVILHGKSGRLSLVCENGIMQVYRRTGVESSLPDKLLSRFDPTNPGS